MADKIKILTPEQVELEYEIAGLGSRLMAFVLDMLILLAGLAALAFVGSIFNTQFQLNPATWSSLATAVFGLISFALFWGYFIFFEIVWNGQSPGKKKLKLRVIRDTGHPINLMSSALRNIVRFADVFVLGLGFWVMFFNERSLRLGDLAGGTLVVKVKMDEGYDSPPFIRKPNSPPGGHEYLMLNADALSRINLLSRQDYEAMRHFIQRAEYVDYGIAENLARQLARPIIERLGLSSSIPSFGFDYEQFLKELARAYERHKGES